MPEDFAWFSLCSCPFLSLSLSRWSCVATPSRGGRCPDDTRSALSFAFQTEKGSALHEAALFGKTDVVHILLAAGEVGSAGVRTHAGPAASPGRPEGTLLAALEPIVCVSPLVDCKGADCS